MDRNIYQELWDIDLQNSGCSVTSQDETGEWRDPEAHIRLDEQQEADHPDADRAPNPLFSHVTPEKLDIPSYQKLITLLNNYIVNARATEDHIGDNEVEDKEREEFLDIVLETEVVKTALQYINNDLGIKMDTAEFKNHLLRLWFSIYTNFFNKIPVANCSGFEHVFVGEGKMKGSGIGGYHCWVKYFLDEKNERVDFRGYNYDGNFRKRSQAGAFHPYVATISMAWQPKDINGNDLPLMDKDMGGFFVGPSPELQLVMPTVAYFESITGNFGTPQKPSNKNIELHDALYTLVLYMRTNEDQSRGDKIRSFFPKFKRPLKSNDRQHIVPPKGDESSTRPDLNDGDISITKAMPNPPGSDIGNEWVEIENNSNGIIDLTGWALLDRMDRAQELSGRIDPNKTKIIFVRREHANAAQLSNKKGEIKLRNTQQEIIAKVSYRKAPEGAILFFSSSD